MTGTTIRPVQKSTLSRMRSTAAIEAERIEIMQRWLVETGLRPDGPSEEQLRMRDDYDAVVRLIDAVEADAEILQRVVKLIRR